MGGSPRPIEESWRPGQRGAGQGWVCSPHGPVPGTGPPVLTDAPIAQIQPEVFLSELQRHYRGDEGAEVFSTAWNTLMVTVSSREAPGGLWGGVEHPQDLPRVTPNAGEGLVDPRQTPSAMLGCSPSLCHLPK